VPKKIERKLIVPRGLDPKSVRSLNATAIRAQGKAFKANSRRFRELQSLKIGAAKLAAMESGVRRTPVSKAMVADTKRIVGSLRRLLPDTPPPTPLIYGPPYSSSIPLQSSLTGETLFIPWDNAPNARTGQVGGSLTAFSSRGGVATVQSAVSSVFNASVSGVYDVDIGATMRGIYYLMSPPYGIAEVEADLYVNFTDNARVPSSYQAKTNLAGGLAGIFGGGRELAPITNPNGLSQFDQRFSFTVGDAPGNVQIDAGIILKVTATPGAVATIDLEMTILSIGFAFASAIP
jgi:hypothetical protein